MKRFLAPLIVVAALTPPGALAQTTALVGGTVVDLDGKTPVANAVVLIEGERIVAVGPAVSTPVPAGATIIPMAGKWLIPGLMNMHVHLALNLPGAGRIYNESREAKGLRMLANAQKSLQSGVTTIRSTGEDGGIEFAVKAAIDGGTFQGPRMHTAGESVTPTGGHGKYEADGTAEISRAVRQQIKLGATWIKLAISGGISDERGAIGASPFTDEEMKTAIEIAHRNGAKVTGHTGSPAASEFALQQGIDGFEHGYFFTPKILKEMKSRGTWYVPTIVVSQKGALEFYKKIGSPPWYLERQASVGKVHWETLRSAIKAGVNIALGSDQYPFEPNEGTTATIREAELYAEAGMTSLQALRAATIEPARMLDVAGQVGEIKPGRLADIVALGADPIADIHALRTISFVMKGGKVARHDLAQ